MLTSSLWRADYAEFMQTNALCKMELTEVSGVWLVYIGFAWALHRLQQLVAYVVDVKCPQGQIL